MQNNDISGEAAVGRDDRFNEPYLPELYRQKVRARQQRRRIKKIVTGRVDIQTGIVTGMEYRH